MLPLRPCISGRAALASADSEYAEMSWAMRKFSRVRPSRYSPSIASRGAKPIECTRMSSPSQCFASWAKQASISASLDTSSGSTMSEPYSFAASSTRHFSFSFW